MLLCIFAVAAGTEPEQSSSEVMSGESGELISRSVDMRLCVLCSQHGDSPSVTVRSQFLSQI